MGTAAARGVSGSVLSDQQSQVLGRFLSLRRSKRERILELAQLYQESTDEVEREEIREALAECLFRPRADLTALPIEQESSPDAARRLAMHRQYVAGQIRKLRQTRGLTQQELAHKSGLPQSHVARLETAKHAPTYRTIEKIAKALGVKPSDIDLGFED
jgi:ribosome-binding protein aMBF1 (putative translation factor)